MSQSPRKSELPPAGDPQGISKWARAYAQNRSLGVVVFMIVFLLLSAAIGGPSYLAGVAYRSGAMPLFWVSIALLVPASGALIYLSTPRCGGKLMEGVVQRLYAKEGHVAFSPPCGRARIWGAVMVACFAASLIASVILEFTLEIPFKYMQPISALCVVPFVIGLWFLIRPMVGYAALLWPALYATHAILILAGAPILLTGPWEGLNILIPMAGYGMLSALVGHFYSRFALAQLKRLTRVDPTGADQAEEAPGQ